MITVWHYTYDTPCGGRAVGLLMLFQGGDDVSIDGHLFQAIERTEGLDVTRDALDLTEELGWPSFASAKEAEGFIAEREGWTLDAPLVIEEVGA